MADFGIYILTYPGDFHLSLPLIRSIRYFHPDIPIMIIPGEGFERDNHPFDVSIMPDPQGFWSELGHQDRDFLAFQGPYKKFLYLDADIVCTHSLKGMIDKVDSLMGKFMLVSIPSDWNAVVGDIMHPKRERYLAMARDRVGNPDLIRQFDPDYDFLRHCPFNSGVWASSRETITEEDVRSLNREERDFFRRILRRDFTWKAKDLFNRDQGRLNYLVSKLGIPVLPVGLDGNWVSGDWPERVTLDDVQKGRCDFHFIHWCGAPRPSPSYLCSGPGFRVLKSAWINMARGARKGRYEGLKEVPGYSVWRHYYEEAVGPMQTLERLRWSVRDFIRSYGLTARRWVRGARRQAIGFGSTVHSAPPSH